MRHPLIRRSVRPIAFITFMGVVPSGVLGQVHGQVLDSQGRAVPDATVEAWGPLKRLQVTGTDGAGRFRLSLDSDESLIIIVRHPGHHWMRVPLEGQQELRVILSSRGPADADSIVVSASVPCPNSEDPAARQLWDAVGRRYSEPGAEAELRAELLSYGEVVGAEQFAILDTSKLQPAQMRAGGAYYEAAVRLIRAKGYATPNTSSSPTRFRDWKYPYLESLLAGHFIDTVFARLHRFSLEKPGGRTIVFCPRDSEASRIQGHLEIGADTSLQSAHWRFETSGPSELAGGHVIFAPPLSQDGRAALIPVTGFFWRRRVLDFYQEWMEFREWSKEGDIP